MKNYRHLWTTASAATLTRSAMIAVGFIFVTFSNPSILLADAKLVFPSPEYSPQQVISIVVQSLQTNSSDNAGIATVYRFASPRNKASTGPLSRFTQMIKRGFPDMLNHTGVRYDPMEISGDIAVQAVWLQTSTGAEFGYAFQLRKQRGGNVADMWMTDAVIPLGKSDRSGLRI